MTKILVTGGAGFIGSFLVDALIADGNKVTVYDNLDPQVHPGRKIPGYLNKKADFVRGDVLNYNSFKKVLLNTDYVVHLAAKVGVGQSQYEISKYVNVNIGGTANLLDILVNNKNKVKKIVVAASMSSYGEGIYACKKCGKVQPPLRTNAQMAKKQWELLCPDCGCVLKPVPTPETARMNSNSIYAITKKTQEEMVLNIGRTYNIPAVALRFFNVFGPRQSLSNPYTGVAAIFMSRIKNNNRPVVFEDGLQTRDFIYVTDIARAIMTALKKDAANYEAFNVGSGSPVTIKDVSKIIAKIHNKQIEPDIQLKFRKGDVRHCYADTSKIKSKLKFTPQVDFTAGMKMLIEWAKTARAVDNYEQAHKELEKKSLTC